jgi:hypothetical protein
MTTGFQQQQHNFGPILKAVAKPQHVGAKLAQQTKRKQVGEQSTFKAAQ